MSRTISIVNHSTVVDTASLIKTIAALQIQLNRDFAPIWSGITAQLKYVSTPGLLGTEAIYLADDTDQAGALGYHDLTAGDVPYGIVFAKTDMDYGEDWRTTLSHELLEDTLDPLVNLGAVAPWNGSTALLSYEACDAVENDVYEINNVPVSNFITPQWFLPEPQPNSTKFDFLSRLHASLTMSPGGYVAYTTDLTNWQQSFARRTPEHQKQFHELSRRGRRQMKNRKHKRMAAIVG